MKYQVSDHPEAEHFTMTFKNEYNEPICYAPETWPSEVGILDIPSESFFIVIDDVKFPMKPFSTGYCPDCYTRVEVDEEIFAHVDYELFNLPPELWGETKRIEFDAMAYNCPN